MKNKTLIEGKTHYIKPKFDFSDVQIMIMGVVITDIVPIKPVFKLKFEN
jgi:hypothetical protein